MIKKYWLLAIGCCLIGIDANSQYRAIGPSPQAIACMKTNCDLISDGSAWFYESNCASGCLSAY